MNPLLQPQLFQKEQTAPRPVIKNAFRKTEPGPQVSAPQEPNVEALLETWKSRTEELGDTKSRGARRRDLERRGREGRGQQRENRGKAWRARSSVLGCAGVWACLALSSVDRGGELSASGYLKEEETALP